MKRLALMLTFAMAVLPAVSQTPVQKPAFEVASVKPAVERGPARIQGEPGGRLVATSITLQLLMTFVYGVQDFQISGGPSWMTTDRWDIEARAPANMVLQRRDDSALGPLTPMAQLLIEERFSLMMHRETRALPVYELAIANGGLKVKLSDDQSPKGLQPNQTDSRGLIAVRRGSA